MRASNATAGPVESLQFILAGELIELHLNGGLQEPQLQKQLPRHRGRFGKTKYRREKIRQVQIEVSQRVDEFLNGGRLRVGQIDLII
jgi:hypothetical protein